MTVSWSDEVDEILAGDLAVALAYATPARGVVITPMAPLGIRDRERGTVTLTSSLGLPKKLARIRRNPAVAVAYHAREHGDSDRPEFVLVQGRASFGEPDREWLESITPQWERFLGPRERGLRGRWMRVYYWERVAIEIEIERLLIWPEESCAGEPRVLGEPLPAEAPAPQKPPANGIAPRIDLEPVERAAGRLPHTLAGWLGADGLPLVVSARVDGAGEQGLQLTVPAANLPPGGRRAGLTSHWFVPRMHGQEQRINTGWLTSDGGERGLYAPHTKAGTRLPPSRALFDLGAGAATRLGIRGARKLGLTS
jgi:nitroimidazol reductase NimA-like FMN-containing flavoprotein (pyridoxamine 5'-phosphate oxidase superfamily)